MEENNFENEKQQEKKSKKSASLLLLLILLVTVSIGFALVSKNLEIHGTSKITKETWEIEPDDEIDPIVCPEGQKCTILDCEEQNGTACDDDNRPTPDDGDCDDDSCNGAVIWMEGNTVYFEHVLAKPGDDFTFTANFKNSGTIDAKVNNVVKSGFGTNTTAKNFMTYDVTYAGKTGAAAEIKNGDIFAAGSTVSYKVYVKYKEVDTLPTDAELALINGTNGKGAVSLFTVEYVQK